MKGKKGTGSDVVFFVIFMFSLVITLLLVGFVNSEIKQAWENNEQTNSSENSLEAVQTGMDKANNSYDYVFLAVFIAFILTMIVTSYFVGGIPIFMFIYFLMVVGSVVMSFYFSNTWESIASNAEFSTIITYFPIANHVMTYLPWYALIIGILGIVIMFAKPYFDYMAK